MFEAIQAVLREVKRLRAGEWTYESLTRILRDKLPLTMTLGLATILVERMVAEGMFAERVEGVVAVVKKIAERAAKAEGDE